MCGIAGVFARDPRERVEDSLVRKMAASLFHRGPDGEGIHCGPGYGLGHRRLAIVDRAGGSQPMTDGSNRLWVTYNGEIYNYRELTSELEGMGYEFATRSDTEVLLHGWRAWGKRLPQKLLGMFAFALVDEERHLLFAARDRLGKKPLHYASLDGKLWFASELKALLEGLPVRPGLRREALARFLCLRYVPDPLTVFEGVQKLSPGHSLCFEDGRLRIEPFWTLSFAAGPEGPRGLDTACEEMLFLFDEVVRARLIGEVPLGAFLSGGIDSFAVLDSMGRASSEAVVACTMGFEEPEFDEREQAREAAHACHAVLHEETVSMSDLLEQSWFDATFDEPFADASAIPTHHVCRLARRHVTVALSGDGGDECFAGYRRYRIDRIENRLRGLAPPSLWRLLGAAYPKADFLPRLLRFKRTLQNLALPAAEAYARSVCASLPEEVLPLLRPAFREAEPDPLGPVRRAYDAADGADPLSRAAAADFATYLPGDILVKVDRASMAVSLEVRSPFLDHRLVELAARMPAAQKLLDGRSKGFLRHAMRGRLGAKAIGRRKRGFAVPLSTWMRGALGDRLESALLADRLAWVLEPAAVQRLLARHRAGVGDHGELLWAVLVLDRFLERWLA